MKRLIRDFRYLAWGASDLETLDGGEGRKVGEHRAVVVFELEAFPEPKALSKNELKLQMAQLHSTVKVAKHIGASQAFVWSKLKK